MLVQLLLLTPIALSTAFWPGQGNKHDEYTPEIPNVYHIFNAIHSSMRQWGSSLNHNGVSFFLATVPEIVLLHHGTSRSERVAGMDWLAFEPEHAMQFAWAPCDDDEALRDASARSPAGSAHALHIQNAKIEGADARDGNQSSTAPPHRRPPFCLTPGYLHTYSTRRPLHLLYLDGQSAAKTEKGTLDTQDHILLHNVTASDPRPPRFVFDDFERAHALCQLARTDLEGRIDGFLRMEHGFEIVLCDFTILDVVSILPAQNQEGGNRFRPDDPMTGEFFLEFMQAVMARYDGIGGERVRINYDDFVTGFAYPGLDLWAQGEELPRLNATSDEIKKRIKDDVERLVLEGRFPGEKRCGEHRLGPSDRGPWFWGEGFRKERLLSKWPFWSKHGSEGKHESPPNHNAPPYSKHHSPSPHTNWQSITDMYIARYAPRLLYLISGKYNTSKTLSEVVTLIYRPYMNRTHHIKEEEVQRCTTAYIPHQLLTVPAAKQSLAQRAITMVAKDICETLWGIMSPYPNTTSSSSSSSSALDSALRDDYEAKIKSLKALMTRLNWTEWKKCRDCGMDEVCFVAIWPFGSQEDHDRPSCKNGTAMMSESSMGYWHDGPGGRVESRGGDGEGDGDVQEL